MIHPNKSSRYPDVATRRNRINFQKRRARVSNLFCRQRIQQHVRLDLSPSPISYIGHLKTGDKFRPHSS